MRTIFVSDDAPFAVVWENGPVVYLHEWADGRLGGQLDARLVADHLRVRPVYAAALEWLVAMESNGSEEDEDDDACPPDLDTVVVDDGVDQAGFCSR